MEYQITQPADPREIDADTPQEVALEAVGDYLTLLTEAVGYAERVEAAVRNSAMQDYLDIPFVRDEARAGSPSVYADLSQEAALAARTNGALATARELAHRLETLLLTPRLERD